MKTKSLPSTRISPELRDEVMQSLQEGESLSSFIEESVRHTIQRRKAQKEFIERGLRSKTEARNSNTYFTADEVITGLEEQLQIARKKTQG